MLFALTVALRSGEAQQPKSDWTIFLQRAGAVRFGMSLSEVRQVIGDREASLYVSDPDNPLGDRGCTYLESARLPNTWDSCLIIAVSSGLTFPAALLHKQPVGHALVIPRRE